MSEIGSNEVQGYHNSIISAELSFQKDLKLLLSAMDEFENLFSDNSYDLYSLDTGYVAPETAKSLEDCTVQQKAQ